MLSLIIEWRNNGNARAPKPVGALAENIVSCLNLNLV